MLFIKKFIDCRKMLTQRAKQMIADNEVDTPEYEQVEAMIDAINRMRDYIATGKWGREKTKDKYVFWLKSRMNYSLTARKFNTTTKSLRVMVSRTDKKLKAIMEKPLEKIMAGEVDDGLLDFNIAINNLDLDVLFGITIAEMIPVTPQSSNCYTFGECQDEIQFLRDYNAHVIRERIKALDSDKLAYLLSLAYDDPGNCGERRQLLKKILRMK